MDFFWPGPWYRPLSLIGPVRPPARASVCGRRTVAAGPATGAEGYRNSTLDPRVAPTFTVFTVGRCARAVRRCWRLRRRIRCRGVLRLRAEQRGEQRARQSSSVTTVRQHRRRDGRDWAKGPSPAAWRMPLGEFSNEESHAPAHSNVVGFVIHSWTVRRNATPRTPTNRRRLWSRRSRR